MSAKRIKHLEDEIVRLNGKLMDPDNEKYERDMTLVKEAIERYEMELAGLNG